MKRYPSIQIVSCKCDVCLERKNFNDQQDLYISLYYDTKGSMVVCDACKDEYEQELKGTAWEPVWACVPDRFIDYEELERDID